ncbi:hypothetical protein P43SY_008857 [Pythium insidiosum]|uniref:Uncharacterized protein n=1 Tax=Pythium insidiosum TaxID=114742 RepID=A0AAD5MGE0_PYTIN|nr:hypothetical protein P43SY_008857 [Pythium insidiosum]
MADASSERDAMARPSGLATPESIRTAYAAPENETPEQRRKRLANKRAAKYRYFLTVDESRRAHNKERQRRRRETLDDAVRSAIREQNRMRQHVRRARMTDADKQERNRRERLRRAQLDDDRRARLREREKLRGRRRRAQQQQRQQREQEQEQEQEQEEDDDDDDPANGHVARRVRERPSVVQLPPLNDPSSASTVAVAVRPLPSLQPQPQTTTIEIAPLQFVLPPASSIQSLTLADRWAPLPQVQNVLPHASTLLHALAPSSNNPLPPISASVTPIASVPVSASLPPVGFPAAAVSTAPGPPPASSISTGSSIQGSALASLLVPLPPQSMLGLLLNPRRPASPLPLPPPPPPPAAAAPVQVTTPHPPLPSLSQLPDFLNSNHTTLHTTSSTHVDIASYSTSFSSPSRSPA